MWANVILIGIFIFIVLHATRALENKKRTSFGRWLKAATGYEFALNTETGRLWGFDIHRLQVTIVVVKKYVGNHVKYVVVRGQTQPIESSLYSVQETLYRDHRIVLEGAPDSPPAKAGDLTPGVEFQRFYRPVFSTPWSGLGVPVTVVDVDDNKEATLAGLDSLTAEQVSSMINVITQFNSTKVQSTTITGIARYRNSRLLKKFKDAQAQLGRFGRPTERLMLFHGTGAENVDS